MPDHDQFDQLLSRYLEGELDADELAALESRLIHDDEFAEYFSRWCLMHRQVVELLSENMLHELMDQFIAGSPALPKQGFSRKPASMTETTRSSTGAGERGNDRDDGRKLHFGRRYLALALALAAAAFVWSAAVWWLDNGRNDAGGGLASAPAEQSPSEPRPEVIATLTRLVECVWQPEAAELHYGQQLTSGDRVALVSGMAKVTFECGAEVVLEGPCDFVVQSQMVGVLHSGRMTADVPRRAFTFAILSPDVDFVDLGTSFGVSIGSKGRTALHVFEGEVLCSQTNSVDRDRKEVLHVTARQAVEFDAGGSTRSDIAMDDQQFSRLIALRRTVDLKPQRLVQDQLALWLAADAAVSIDANEGVISWRDIVYGDNVSAEDAIQANEEARPRLVPGAIHGHPALRFDGNSDFLLTTPLETTDNQTVLFVCQFSPNAFDPGRRWGGQILNYDGPDREPENMMSDQELAERTRYLSNTHVPGFLQIGEPLLEEEFKPTLLTGQVFSGFVGRATIDAGRVDAVPIGATEPVVIAYRYDYDGGQASLWINGRSFGEARAFAPQAVTSRKIIGRHAWKQLFFHGDLAELLIYNKALSPEELQQTTVYLAEKYSIPLDPNVPVQPHVGE